MELSPFYGNANETSKQNSISEQEPPDDPKQLVQIKKIGDSPFTAIKHLEKWYLCIGKYRLSEELPSYKECVKESKDTSWWRVMAVMRVIAEDVYENEKLAGTIDKQKMNGLTTQTKIQFPGDTKI